MDLTPELCPPTTSQSDTYPECEALQQLTLPIPATEKVMIGSAAAHVM